MIRSGLIPTGNANPWSRLQVGRYLEKVGGLLMAEDLELTDWMFPKLDEAQIARLGEEPPRE